MNSNFLRQMALWASTFKKALASYTFLHIIITISWGYFPYTKWQTFIFTDTWHSKHSVWKDLLSCMFLGVLIGSILILVTGVSDLLHQEHTCGNAISHVLGTHTCNGSSWLYVFNLHRQCFHPTKSYTRPAAPWKRTCVWKLKYSSLWGWKILVVAAFEHTYLRTK